MSLIYKISYTANLIFFSVTGYAVLLNNKVQIKTVHPGSSSEVIGLVLTWRPGFKSLSGYDCK